MKGKKDTILKRTSRPFLAVLVIVVGMYTATIWTSVLSYLESDAADMFDQQVESRQLYVENALEQPVLYLNNSLPGIVEKMESVAEAQGKEISQIHSDGALNQAILEGMMEDTIRTLRECGSTEIFLILDGPLQDGGAEGKKAGIYIRNSDPAFYSESNQDLLFERGVPGLSKTWKLPLDSFWTADCSVDRENGDYFYQPLEAARENPGADPEKLAYWCYGNHVSDLDKGIFSYSLPLVASDGEVIGVMGVGINEDYFLRDLDYLELGDGGTGAYFLAKTTDGKTYTPVIFNGYAYDRQLYLDSEISIEDSGHFRYLVKNGEETQLCVAAKTLRLYDTNTPFEGEQWVLLGIRQEGNLLMLVREAESRITFIAVAALLLGLFGAYWSGRLLSDPVQKLVVNLRKSDPNRAIRLDRLGIEEIDELVASVELLSDDVADTYRKISNIVQLSDVGIGVFEYKTEENLVFCSQTLYQMLGWSEPEEGAAYVDATSFRENMEALRAREDREEKNLFLVRDPDGKKRWIRLREKQEEKSILGVLVDVTPEILERQKIEYERDYDVLTNICNRRAFEEKLRRLFQEPQKLGTAAYIVWDLDNLKFVNDRHGHARGDAYIILMADCLRKAESVRVLSARRSGDEFVTFLYGGSSEEEIQKQVDEIWQMVQKGRMELPGGKEYRLRVSAGVAWYPKHTTDEKQLFQYADFAMYTAKHSSKGRMAVFDASIYQKDGMLVQGQEAFDNLLEKRMVRYALQPVLSVETGDVFGYEMLMRPELSEFRTPDEVLKMAHAQSKLYDIEIMTWLEAMKTFSRLVEYRMVKSDSFVFINSISNQMMTMETIRLFESTFSAFLPQIVCEFTEEEQGNSEITQAKIELIHKWGGRIALDDYGCGYNGETILIDIQPDIVKIDMSIVHGIDGDPGRQFLVRSLVCYAHERGIQILGEGVETAAELEVLVEIGVDLLQGYYLAPPSYNGQGPEKHILDKLREARGKRIIT